MNELQPFRHEKHHVEASKEFRLENKPIEEKKEQQKDILEEQLEAEEEEKTMLEYKGYPVSF